MIVKVLDKGFCTAQVTCLGNLGPLYKHLTSTACTSVEKSVKPTM